MSSTSQSPSSASRETESADAQVPITTLTALQYLQARVDLPALIMQALKLDEETKRIPPLLADAPVLRELEFDEKKIIKGVYVDFDATENKHINTVRWLSNVKAMLVFITGIALKHGEGCCEGLDENMEKCTHGIFPFSVVPQDGNYERKLTSVKACANCQYDDDGSKCPLQKAENAKKTGNVDDDDDDDTEEESNKKAPVSKKRKAARGGCFDGADDSDDSASSEAVSEDDDEDHYEDEDEEV